MTSRIVEALVGRLTKLPARNRPTSLEAYELCVRARPLIANFAGSAEAIREFEILLRQAVAKDPSYAEAVRWLAFTLWSYWTHSIGSPESKRPESLEMARRAVALDPNDAGNHWVLGYLLAYEHNWAESDAAFDAALRVDPNHADTFAMRAELVLWQGETARRRTSSRRRSGLTHSPPAGTSGYWAWCTMQRGGTKQQSRCCAPSRPIGPAPARYWRQALRNSARLRRRSVKPKSFSPTTHVSRSSAGRTLNPPKIGPRSSISPMDSGWPACRTRCAART